MTDDEHLAVEVAQFVQHVHDIAGLLAERMGSLSTAEAEALLDQQLARLAVRAKQLEAASGMPRLLLAWVQSVRRDPDARGVTRYSHIARLRAMVDFSSLAKVLARAERETTLCVLQTQLSIANRISQRKNR